MSKNGNATLKDIAQETGVAISTVSRILSNSRGGFSVREATRERVLAVADRLNYRPNPIVRSLRAKKTNLIAVLGLSDFGSSLRGSTEVAVEAFKDGMLERGYELCTNIISRSEDPFSLPRWRVDGAMVVDCPSVSMLGTLEASGVPYVAMNCASGPLGSSVMLDDAMGTVEAVRHLVSKGHRKISFCFPDAGWKPHHSLGVRHGAYAAESARLGAEAVTRADEIGRSADRVIGQDVVERGATAVIAYHHVMGVRLLRAATLRGLVVPRDLSLVCFNDSFPCADLAPSMSAVSLPSEEMGREAARLLLELLDEKAKASPVKLEIPERLVVRESTGLAPIGSARVGLPG